MISKKDDKMYCDSCNKEIKTEHTVVGALYNERFHFHISAQECANTEEEAYVVRSHRDRQAYGYV